MTLTEWAGMIGTGAGAAGLAWRKFKATIGETPAKGEGSLRDLVLEIRGEVRAVAATQDKLSKQITAQGERIAVLEHPWAGRTQPGLGNSTDAE